MNANKVWIALPNTVDETMCCTARSGVDEPQSRGLYGDARALSQRSARISFSSTIAVSETLSLVIRAVCLN
jgi:hypothetical protein